MLQLAGTGGDAVRVITGQAADIAVHASWIENNAGTVTADRTNTASIVTATTTTVVAGPSTGLERRVKHLNIRNNHASQACDVTVDHTDGTNIETLIKCSLAPGEVLLLDEKGEWRHYDANAGEYPDDRQIADRGDIEGSVSLREVVTPGRQHFHPGHPKAWAKAGITANLLASYNMTSVTDTAVGRIAFTIATDFANIGYNIALDIQRDSASLAVGEILNCTVRNATPLVGSFEGECYDFTATTAVLDDPTAWYMSTYGKQV